ncbi:hypothetical protein GCM10010232_13160 [Streptomyces amakusaensis]|uniref:Uncharacterized protein n=1 Tax=Streptomyces amakusaensis TaxID=67271 RepID=A0ABW0AC73_9ACTN
MNDGMRAEAVEAVEAELRKALRREAGAAPQEHAPVDAVLSRGREERRRRSETRMGVVMVAGVMAVVVLAVFGNRDPDEQQLPLSASPDAEVTSSALPARPAAPPVRKAAPYESVDIGRGMLLALVPEGKHFYALGENEADLAEQTERARGATSGMLMINTLYPYYTEHRPNGARLVSGVFRTESEPERVEVWIERRDKVHTAQVVRLRDDTSWGAFYVFLPERTGSFEYGVVAYAKDGSVLAAGEGSHTVSGTH